MGTKIGIFYTPRNKGGSEMGGIILFIFGLFFGALFYHDFLWDNQIIERLTHKRDELINRYEYENGG